MIGAAIACRTPGFPSGTHPAHRLLLRSLMLQHGFKPYPKAWWHFTLAENVPGDLV
jgi:D-alanyl-D-alanine dipeptidase